MESRYPEKKLTIIGGGIIAAMEAYFAYLDAKEKGEPIRITIHEKNKNLLDMPVFNIVPSLTPDEILSVVPRGQELVKKLQILFSEPGGIRVEDVEGVNSSTITHEFIQQVQRYSADEEAHALRTKTLLELGKRSMDLWRDIYDHADAALKKILEESNFNPCREPRMPNDSLHDGYRIDLIYHIPDATAKANVMKADYEALGYQHCKVLSPSEVMQLDPFLKDFCISHSVIDDFGKRHWKNDAVALWRPGGCINTQIFLPKFYDYLKNVMGQYEKQYENSQRKIKDCFKIHFEREVIGLTYKPDAEKRIVNGLRFFGAPQVKHDKHTYKSSSYVLCPGEAVGTLRKLGLKEPAYARFAGASLILEIPVSDQKMNQYANFNHCMEVHQEGVVLAWQGQFRNHKIFIGVAGTKAFYADKKPHKDEAFAKNRNLLQLNMINEVLPEFISLALGRDTKGQKLVMQDLIQLEQTGIAKRWVGSRAVAYDGFPTEGAVYNESSKVNNMRCTTHLGSGGVSFAPAITYASRSIWNEFNPNELTETVLAYGDSKRGFSYAKL